MLGITTLTSSLTEGGIAMIFAHLNKKIGGLDVKGNKDHIIGFGIDGQRLRGFCCAEFSGE